MGRDDGIPHRRWGLPIRGQLPRRGLGTVVCVWSLISVVAGVGPLLQGTAFRDVVDALLFAQLVLLPLGAAVGAAGGWRMRSGARGAVPTVLVGLSLAGLAYVLQFIAFLIPPNLSYLGEALLLPATGVASVAVAAYVVAVGPMAPQSAPEREPLGSAVGQSGRAVGLVCAAWFAIGVVGTIGAATPWLAPPFTFLGLWPPEAIFVAVMAAHGVPIVANLLCALGGAMAWRGLAGARWVIVGGAFLLLGSMAGLVPLGYVDWFGFAYGVAFPLLLLGIVARNFAPPGAVWRWPRGGVAALR